MGDADQGREAGGMKEEGMKKKELKNETSIISVCRKETKEKKERSKATGQDSLVSERGLSCMRACMSTNTYFPLSSHSSRHSSIHPRQTERQRDNRRQTDRQGATETKEQTA